MSGLRINVSSGVLVVLAICIPASALAQIPASVRVVDRPAPIQRWYRKPVTEVLVKVDPGTTLEVLDEENGWFWVIAPPTVHGTRKAGWIRASHVEPVIPEAAPPTSTPVQGGEPGAAGAPPTAINEDKVSITPRQDGTAASRANTPPATRAYTFEDVHFDRNRDALRQEDVAFLQATVTALKADPALTVNIEGYTCNLGTPAYNLALGARRANAVKRYLMSEGIAGDRLHTVSLGEGNAKHDNSHEETRRLNRRVALVPTPQP